jgi:serine/threonine-protein kinase mTOR
MFTRLVGHVLNEFVRNCALPYLEEDHLDVRKAAALTCCSVFRRDPIGFQGSNNSIEIISDVIDKLLTVGIADPGSSHSVLDSRLIQLLVSRCDNPASCSGKFA